MAILGMPTRYVFSVLVLLHLFGGAAVRVVAADSLCQALDPSPVLEPFVDELTQPSEIDISSGSPITLGAYKIKQVHNLLTTNTVANLTTIPRML